MKNVVTLVGLAASLTLSSCCLMNDNSPCKFEGKACKKQAPSCSCAKDGAASCTCPAGNCACKKG